MLCGINYQKCPYNHCSSIINYCEYSQTKYNGTNVNKKYDIFVKKLTKEIIKKDPLPSING